MTRLLVPVSLDVLLVREAGARFADAGMAAPTADGQRHRDLWKAPFSELAAGRARGAYLHWALPDALTAGTTTADGGVQFHAIPDRWLVTRLSRSATGRRAVRGWVLESDRAVAHPLDGWQESGAPQAGVAPLTALGHGDVAWAAYFDNVENRLAFHDDLADVPAGPISYLVCGWYASATLDPLADPALTTRAALRTRLSALRWSFGGPGAQAPDGQQPSGTLYHGSAVNLSWPAAATAPEVGGPPPASAVRVVVGSTACEALATLVARDDGEVRVLEAAQLGVLTELAEPDGLARLDTVLHASAFASRPGGEVIEQVEQPQTPPAPSAVPLSPIVTSGLSSPGASPVLAAAAVTGAPPRVGVRKAAEIEPRVFTLPDRVRELAIAGATLSDTLGSLPPDDPSPPPTGLVDVHRALPRFFYPADPVVLIQGARRAFRHGGDGRFTADGDLGCRVAADAVVSMSMLDPGTAGARVSVTGDALVDRGIGNPNVPAECETLLREVALLDPGAAPVIAQIAGGPAASGAPAAVLARRAEVEQTAWWAARDLRVDPAGVLGLSGLGGTLPSPIAVTPPARPWTPLHLEWSAVFTPSPRGPRDWTLGEVDFAPAAASSDGGVTQTFQGRMLLTPGAATIAAGAAKTTIRRAVRVGTAATLAPGVAARFASDVAAKLDAHLGALVASGDDGGLDLVSALGAMDILGGALDPLDAELRGGIGFDEPEPVPAPREPNFALRAGQLRLTRLRLVDCFGQFVDLLGGDAGAATVTVGETLRLDGATDQLALPPRLTAPARLWLRYSDGAGGEALAGATTSPVAGFLLPNHLDAALELFDASGTSRGELRAAADGGLSFEAAPGIATTLGRSPLEALGNPALAGIVQGLLDWGAADARSDRDEDVLTALLRLIDAHRWSVDPQGQGGNEDLGPLVGRPVAVLTARARLEVAAQDAARLAAAELPLRLGSVAHLQDGLYGVFAGGDFRTLHVAGPAAALAREVGPGRGYLQQVSRVAEFHARFADDVPDTGDGGSPVVHPYMARDVPIPLVPSETVNLVLLVEPYAEVNATTGVLPRKSIGMRREWLSGALARLAPTFRFGPVLVDPAQVRLPIARGAAGTWSWAHRLDETTWSEEAVVDAAGQTATAGDRVTASEGWLRFVPSEGDGQ